jgi:DmsE family decaheme c-type cytochrome
VNRRAIERLGEDRVGNPFCVPSKRIILLHSGENMKNYLKMLPALGLIAGVLLMVPATTLAEDEYSAKGADTCLMCHRAEKWGVMPIFQTKHGSLTDPDAPFSNLQCESCHGPSNAHVKAKNKAEVKPKVSFGENDMESVSEQNGMCLSCHEKHDHLGWMGSAHESSDVACTSCHSIHVERDPISDPLQQQDVCFTCHQSQRADVLKASGHPLRFGNMSCSDCHNVHDGFSDHLLVEDNVNDTCYRCHAEKRGPFLWEHAPVTEDCSLCHDPHGSNHPASLKRRPPLLCQQCHSAADHPGVAYTSEGIDPDSPNRFLLLRSCMNCHAQVHGSNHPSGSSQMR